MLICLLKSIYCIGSERTTPNCGTQYSLSALVHLAIWGGDDITNVKYSIFFSFFLFPRICIVVVLNFPSGIFVSRRCNAEDLKKFLFLYTYNCRWTTERPVLGTRCGG
jgi:hypothetical protein